MWKEIKEIFGRAVHLKETNTYTVWCGKDCTKWNSAETVGACFMKWLELAWSNVKFFKIQAKEMLVRMQGHD